jgi:hypothetical protein
VNCSIARLVSSALNVAYIVRVDSSYGRNEYSGAVVF